jgi:uncharacterized protein YcfL
MKALLGTVLLASAALLSGCATNVNTVSRAQPQATPNLVADQRVITDQTLAGLVRIVSVNESVVSGNLKKVQVTLENLKSNPRMISYKFEWTADDGMAIDGPADTWKSLQLMGRETKSISTVSFTPKAVDFTLKIQESR